MLYIPYPFQCCTKCGTCYLPTPEFFYQREDGRLRTECKRCRRDSASRYHHAHKPPPHVNLTREEVLEREREYARRKWREDAAYREYQKNYRKQHPPKSYPEYHHEYYQRHREEIIARAKVNEQKAKEKDPEKFAERARARSNRYGHKYPDRVRQRAQRYQKENMHKIRVQQQRRKARKKSLPNNFTVEDWDRALGYFAGCCAYCGNPPGLLRNMRFHQDHFIPVSDQRPDNPGYVPENIVPACGHCNNSKYNSDPIEWLNKKFGARKARQILARIEAYFEWVKSQK